MICKECGESNPELFYKSIKTYCKEHWKERVRKNRADKIEYYRDFDKRRYRENPERKARCMASTKLYPEAHAKANKKYRSQNPKKWEAHCAVNNAVRDGKLVKPDTCQECGSSGIIHGHHDDYRKPLDVRWLCPVCHYAWHTKYGEGKF